MKCNTVAWHVWEQVCPMQHLMAQGHGIHIVPLMVLGYGMCVSKHANATM